MSAHVLLNLLNELGKRDKMRGLPSILSLFCNEFNKFNNTRARMLDSIYHNILYMYPYNIPSVLTPQTFTKGWNFMNHIRLIVLCFVVRYFMSILELQSS